MPIALNFAETLGVAGVPTRRTGARTTATEIARNQPPKLEESAAHRFVRNVDAALGQQILDITERQCELGIEPDRVLDNLGRKTMELEGKWDHAPTVPFAGCSHHRINVSMPACMLVR